MKWPLTECEAMTLRDQFAAQALCGLLAAESDESGAGAFTVSGGAPKLKGEPAHFAAVAYSLADAMLTARGAGTATVSASTADAMRAALELYGANAPAYRGKNLGSPGSDARLAQDEHIAAEDAGRAALALYRRETGAK